MSAEEITVVLAHGAWADGSSWARVIEGLRLAGQRATPLITRPDLVTQLILDAVRG